MKRILLAGLLLTLTIASAVLAQQSGLRAFPQNRGLAEGCTESVLPMMAEESENRFTTSYTCELCHGTWPGAQALHDEKGRAIGPYTLWQASMMANSARDPLFRAVMSAEMMATPSRAAQIESECMRCHAPMAYMHARINSLELPSLDTLYHDSTFSLLALDGVSCSVCHQISPEGLGTPATFSGNFRVGDGTIEWGPHKNPVTGPMQGATGYTPTYGAHVMESSMCATCHTFFVDTYTHTGAIGKARFPEQTPYHEWRNSIFNTEVAKPHAEAKSCQACHMPTVSEDGVPLKSKLARTPGGGDFRQIQERSPFGRHIFVGANTLLPQIFIENDKALNPIARPQDFENQIGWVRDFVSKSTAKLAISDLKRADGRVNFSVNVENLAGHKVPTGYPSRRSWLRVRIKDADGKVLWASGTTDGNGMLLGADGKQLPSEFIGGPIIPHMRKIEKAGEVQIWEGILADVNGKPTFRLMRAASYAKDNRLLPKGWRDDYEDMAHVKPVGTEGDKDFVGGSDTVAYSCDVGGAKGALTVDVDLFYQTLSPRYAAEMFGYNTREVREFQGYYEKTDKLPERVTRVTAKVD
ncbi:MAG: hypothetical protein IT462_18020 [Planctomycetes bacterium]|nr:hypothetical protein [Planctomycetota bacterium]